MELVHYVRLLRKWFWLLLIGGFLAGGAAFIYASRQTNQYVARATISVGSFIEAPNPDSSEIRTGVELAQTYAVLAQTYDVLQAAVEAGGFPVSPGQLGGMVSISVVEDTSLLRLSVTYEDPVLAADMANEVARQLIINSPSNLTDEQQSQIDLANAEIERLNQELQRSRVRLGEIDAQLAATTDQAEIDRLTEQRNIIVTQINQASANIAQFTNSIATLQQRTNSLDIVEQARIPTAPMGTGRFSRTLMGVFFGMALAGGLALMIEYLDDTIRTGEDATELLVLPMLATISRFGKSSDSYPDRLITYHDPGSHVAEEYRALRINMLFSSNGSWSKGAYIITSAGPSEGKSITASNLAVTMAMAGLRVLLVDADLRRPRIHEIFGLDNQLGLSTLLFATPDTDDHYASDAPNLKDCLQETGIPGLRVITSGFIPLNPTEALGSAAMQRWFQEFQQARNVDVILFDTPPALVVADCSALAAATQAPLVLVLEAGQTRRSAAIRARDQFTNLDLPIKGIVLNAINPRDQNYGSGGYSYYYYYREGSNSGTSEMYSPRPRARTSEPPRE